MLTIDLSGKTALVVGGSRGIGAGITEALCRAGAHVVFTWTGNPDYRARVDALLAGVRAAGGSLQAEAVDARDLAATCALADRVAGERGGIDVLVFNVGKNIARPAESMGGEDWKAAISINLDTAFNAVRAVLPWMLKAGRGRIVLIGSSTVFDGGGGGIDYAAGKAALIGMMKFLCRTYTRKGILTNIVHPCVIETDLLKERYADPDAKAKLVAQVPVGRLGRPEDVAGLVAYLASPWGDFICGQEILLDGGRTLYGK
jgi:NAD(P)-dependent dehydrogenase (short-subunit alcohol dehydrogenase family)